MATVHISAAAAAQNFGAMLARVQAGETFVIDGESFPVAVISAPELKTRRLSEIVADLKRDEARMAKAPLLDPEFAEAIEERIRNRKPRDPSRWV